VFLLDTNVYINAFTRGPDHSGFRAFHAGTLPQLILSAVVVHELRVGTRSAPHRRQLDALVEVFRTRRRLHVPTLATWQLAATIDQDLRELGGYAASLGQRSFANDILLAATARELGATIITNNLADFEVISRVLSVKAVAPWPSAT
jgi:predicted nucleic acid-binding protein